MRARTRIILYVFDAAATNSKPATIQCGQHESAIRSGPQTTVSRTPAGTHAFFAHNHAACHVYMDLFPLPIPSLIRRSLLLLGWSKARSLFHYPLAPEERFVIRVLLESLPTGQLFCPRYFLVLSPWDSVTPFSYASEHTVSVMATKVGRMQYWTKPGGRYYSRVLLKVSFVVFVIIIKWRY